MRIRYFSTVAAILIAFSSVELQAQQPTVPVTSSPLCVTMSIKCTGSSHESSPVIGRGQSPPEARIDAEQQLAYLEMMGFACPSGSTSYYHEHSDPAPCPSVTSHKGFCPSQPVCDGWIVIVGCKFGDGKYRSVNGRGCTYRAAVQNGKCKLWQKSCDHCGICCGTWFTEIIKRPECCCACQTICNPCCLTTV